MSFDRKEYYQKNKERYKKLRQTPRAKEYSRKAAKKYQQSIKGKVTNMLGNIRYRSKGKTDIDREWITKHMENGCELTRIPFKISEKYMNIFSPSIDKIDPQKRYFKENCRIILFGLNALKGSALDEEMYFVAEKLIERREK